MENLRVKTDIWDVLHCFEVPLEAKRIELVDTPLKMPIGVDEAIRKSWNLQLVSKQEQLSKSGICTGIKPYHNDTSSLPLNALYEGEKCKMWPGPVISLTSWQEMNEEDNNVFRLYVGQTSFPFIAGLKDPEISKLYGLQGIPKPRPALAVCTFASTLDKKLVLTLRGQKTPMYPGRMYGQGGNPLFTNVDITVHQKDENRDEILLNEEDYLLGKGPSFLGLIVDTEQLPDKPDIVGYYPVNIESESLLERIQQRPLDKRPNDAIGISFAPSEEGKLFDYLAKETIPKQFCPPAHGGLVLYGSSMYGKKWAEDLLKKLNRA